MIRGTHIADNMPIRKAIFIYDEHIHFTTTYKIGDTLIIIFENTQTIQFRGYVLDEITSDFDFEEHDKDFYYTSLLPCLTKREGIYTYIK